MDVLIALASLFLGIAITYLVTRSSNRHRVETARLEFENELSTVTVRLEAETEKLREEKTRFEALDQTYKNLSAEFQGLSNENTALLTTVENERTAAADKLKSFLEAQDALKDAFSSLSIKALKENSETFTATAKQVLKGYQEKAVSDLDQRQEGIKNLVEPVKEQLEKVNKYVREVEKDRGESYATLNEQIANMKESHGKLNESTSKLVKVLGNTQSRGQWGEIQLRKVVELAGMVPYCDFAEQVHSKSETGGQRPDLIVKLPADRLIIVDAKAPMDAFLEAHETDDESKRDELLTKHAKSLRLHFGLLSSKKYQSGFEQACDFVFMFLPNDAVYRTALEYDPALIEDGARENVIIATPVTLIALLKAVAFGWRQEKIAGEVKRFSELGKQFYDRLAKVTEHISSLGRSLESATNNYNSVVGSVEKRLIPTAKRFHESNIVGDDSRSIRDIASIDVTPRTPDRWEPLEQLDPETDRLGPFESTPLLPADVNDENEEISEETEEVNIEIPELEDEQPDESHTDEGLSLEEFLR